MILEIFLVIYTISVILFFVTARYRVPILPVLILFSAYALDRIVKMTKKRPITEWGKYILIFLLISIPINIRIPGYASANPGQAYYSMGVLYSKQGDKIKAKEEFHRALQYNPTLTEALVNLGSIYGDEGKHQLALDYYQKALELGGDSAFVLYNIGIEYHNQGLWDKAQASYEQSLSIRDDNPRVYYLLGEVYLEKQMLDMAISAYENVIRYDPKYVMAYHRLGMIYHQIGKKEETIYNLERFTQLWQGEPDQIQDVKKLLEELKTE